MDAGVVAMALAAPLLGAVAFQVVRVRMLSPIGDLTARRRNTAHLPWFLGGPSHLLLTAMTVWLTMLIALNPNAGPWSTVLGGPRHPASPTAQLLALAAALLALLLFAGTFFHGLAKPDADAETYLGVRVDTYLSARSWWTDLIRVPLFRCLVVALFVLPLLLHWADADPTGGAWVRAAWCACFVVVGATLLMVATDVLGGATTRFLQPRRVRLIIENDLADAARRDLRATRREASPRAEVADWAAWYLSDFGTMPSGQRPALLRATVSSDAYRREVGRCEQAGDAHRWSQIELGRWSAILQVARDRNLDASARQLLVNIGLSAAALLDTYAARIAEQSTALEGALCPVGDLPTSERFSVLAAPWSRDRGPHVVMMTAVVFRDLAAILLPPEEPALCEQDSLLRLVGAADRLRHEPTRAWALSRVLDAAIASTITHRSPSATMPADALSPLVSTRWDALSDATPATSPVADALAHRALVAMTDAGELADVAREHLLTMMTPAGRAASLVYRLQYGHRSHRAVTSDELGAHHRSLASFRLAMPAQRRAASDVAVEFVVASPIQHLLSDEDVRWLYTQLDQPAGTAAVEAHRRRNLRDFPLREFLLWRYLAGDWSGRASTVKGQDAIDPDSAEEIRHQVEQTVKVLNQVDERLASQVAFDLRQLLG